jgi:hypothetical protein
MFYNRHGTFLFIKTLFVFNISVYIFSDLLMTNLTCVYGFIIILKLYELPYLCIFSVGIFVCPFLV